jgi:hypothetical protein
MKRRSYYEFKELGQVPVTVRTKKGPFKQQTVQHEQEEAGIIERIVSDEQLLSCHEVECSGGNNGTVDGSAAQYPMDVDDIEIPASSNDELAFTIAQHIFKKHDNKYDSYQIDKDIYGILDEQLRNDRRKLKLIEKEKPIEVLKGSTVLMSEAIKKLHNCFLQEHLSIKTRNNILHVISDIFGVAFPRYNYNEQSQPPSTTRTADAPFSSVLSFHNCENGDHVYVGTYSDDLQCMNCSELRTGKCRMPSCRGIPANMHCSHGFTYKTPKRVMQYRPFCVHLQKALQYNLFYSLATCSFSSADHDWDVMLKPVALEQMQQMEEVWNALPSSQKEGRKSLNLLVGVNYDAVKVYEHKATHFSPLLVTIFNMPPFLRYKKGVGVFCVSGFDGLTGEDYKDSERFLISKCFVDELIMLSKGVEIKLIDENFEEQSYVVQVRLIHHGYDTSEMEKTLRIASTANAYQWCFLCNGVKGGNRADVGTTCHCGNRGALGLRHVLRYRGQSLNCCPWGFYGEHPSHIECGEPDLTENANSKLADEALEHKVTSLGLCYSEERRGFRTCVMNETHRYEVRNILHPSNDDFEWLHADIIDLKDFLKIIAPHAYYEHMDYRPVIPHKRTTNATYYSKALNFYEINADPNRKKIEEYEGVKGIFPYAKLFYSDIRYHICWDAFHIIKNYGARLIELWKNERSNKNKIRIYCHKNRMHPEMYEVTEVVRKMKVHHNNTTNMSSSNITEEKECFVKESKLSEREPPWVISTMMRSFIDHVVGSILLPSGTKQDFQIPSIFAATGNLNGVAKIKIMVVLMDLVNFCLYNYGEYDYSETYLYFYKMISQDMCKLMCRGFSDRAVDALVEELKETVSLNEGLFPPTETLAGTHQLIDIASHIKTFGPISSWWTLGSERTVGNIGSKYVTGGSKPYKTAMNTEFSECDAAIYCSLNASVCSQLFANIRKDSIIPRSVKENVLTAADDGKRNEEEDDDDDNDDDDDGDDELEEVVRAIEKEMGSNPNKGLQDNEAEEVRSGENEAVPNPDKSLHVKSLEKEFHKHLLRDVNGKLIAIPGDSFCEDKHVIKNDVSLTLPVQSRILQSLCLHLTRLTETRVHSKIELLKLSMLFRLSHYLSIGKSKNSLLYRKFKVLACDELESSSKSDEFALWLKYLLPAIKYCLKDNKEKDIIAYDRIRGIIKSNEDQDMSHLFEGRLYHNDIKELADFENALSDGSLQQWLTFFAKVNHKGCIIRSKKLTKDNAFSIMRDNSQLGDRDVIDSWCFIGENVTSLSEDLAVGQVLSVFQFRMNDTCPLCKETWLIYDAFSRTPSSNVLKQSFFQGLIFVHCERQHPTIKITNLSKVFPSSLAVLLLQRQIGKGNKDKWNRHYSPIIYSKKNVNHLQQTLHYSFTSSLDKVDTICLFALEPYNKAIL